MPKTITHPKSDVFQTLVFEDHGQDFLEWDIDEAGKVVDSRPFQALVWSGGHVKQGSIKVGYCLEYNRTGDPHDWRTMRYPLKSVKVRLK